MKTITISHKETKEIDTINLPKGVCLTREDSGLSSEVIITCPTEICSYIFSESIKNTIKTSLMGYIKNTRANYYTYYFDIIDSQNANYNTWGIFVEEIKEYTANSFLEAHKIIDNLYYPQE